MKTTEIIPNRDYKHLKSQVDYTVICVADQESNLQSVVVYKSKLNGRIWTRPTVEFAERFELIDYLHGKHSINNPIDWDEVKTNIEHSVGGAVKHFWTIGEATEQLIKQFKSYIPKQVPNEQQAEVFNQIDDLRPFLLNHPDFEMVRTSCLHFLGDKFKEFADISTKSELRIVNADELWDKFSESIGEDIDSLNFFAGKTVITKSNFLKALSYTNKEKEDKELTHDDTDHFQMNS